MILHNRKPTDSMKHKYFWKFKSSMPSQFPSSIITQWDRGSTVVKVLCYKSEGRLFDPSWRHRKFFIDIKSFRSHYGAGVDSASNRNEYQQHFLGGKVGRCVRLISLPVSFSRRTVRHGVSK